MDLINTVHCCDNLELLTKIPDNFISLIYCDILYGTGRNFGDFQDLMADFAKINLHYRPRFKEMGRVLRQNGLIYIQMDYRISHWIRCLLDETFGYNNCRNEIIWHYNSAPRKKFDFGCRHDTIFRYSKSDTYTFNAIREPYSLTAPRGYEKEKYYNPDGKVIGDVWQMNILGQNDKTERVGYQTQKPLKLAEQIIISSSNPGDLVADFYMGSGTVLVAAKKLGRNYLGCDISLKAKEITERRLKFN